MKKLRKITVRVTLVLPENAKVGDVAPYVREAVQCWHGSLRPPDYYHDLSGDHPGHPMFLLDSDTVKVMRIK